MIAHTGRKLAAVPCRAPLCFKAGTRASWLLATWLAVTATDILRAASAALVIHHSTLQKRLTQAEKLLGWDVITPLGKLRAQLALALYRLAASRA